MYPSRKETLEQRINDLNTRLEELDSYIGSEFEWVVNYMSECRLSDVDLLSVDVKELYAASDIYKALALAERELQSIDE